MTPIWPPKLRPGDTVKGSECYGAITSVRRVRIQWIATTTSGEQLAFRPWDRPRLANR
ncbi:hypothetical protein [Amycolatopsis anabasis]|uniref:hypothetical protein n=1 Tax=Amycolatopsis anabasis TaxID=1840409 RepID=UPI00131C56B3|nr:hypothetical protein [Amycolatopsis anabasis]